jgi:hypothetical protein
MIEQSKIQNQKSRMLVITAGVAGAGGSGHQMTVSG